MAGISSGLAADSCADRTAALAVRIQTHEPLAAAVDHMLLMAQQACAESGHTRTEVVKEKRFDFPDDESFKRHVIGLIEAQKGHCALTGLRLQLSGVGNDEQMLASLDRRIDSDEHYTACRYQSY